MAIKLLAYGPQPQTPKNSGGYESVGTGPAVETLGASAFTVRVDCNHGARPQALLWIDRAPTTNGPWTVAWEKRLNSGSQPGNDDAWTSAPRAILSQPDRHARFRWRVWGGAEGLELSLGCDTVDGGKNATVTLSAVDQVVAAAGAAFNLDVPIGVDQTMRVMVVDTTITDTTDASKKRRFFGTVDVSRTGAAAPVIGTIYDYVKNDDATSIYVADNAAWTAILYGKISVSGNNLRWSVASHATHAQTVSATITAIPV